MSRPKQKTPFPLVRWVLLLLVPLYMVWQMRDANVHDAESPLPATGVNSNTAAATRAAFIAIAIFGLIRFLQVAGVGSMQTFFNVYDEMHVDGGATTGVFLAAMTGRFSERPGWASPDLVIRT